MPVVQPTFCGRSYSGHLIPSNGPPSLVSGSSLGITEAPICGFFAVSVDLPYRWRGFSEVSATRVFRSSRWTVFGQPEGFVWRDLFAAVGRLSSRVKRGGQSSPDFRNPAVLGIHVLFGQRPKSRYRGCPQRSSKAGCSGIIRLQNTTELKSGNNLPDIQLMGTKFWNAQYIGQGIPSVLPGLPAAAQPGLSPGVSPP